MLKLISDHTANNHGAISGVCQVCDGPVAHHQKYLNKDGKEIEIIREEKQYPTNAEGDSE